MATATTRKSDCSKPARVRRRFTHEERVSALLILDAKRGAAVRAVARQLGIPETTLRRWASGERSPAAKQSAPLHREQLADVFERAAWEVLAVSPDRLGRLTFLQLIRAAAVAVDALVRLRAAPALPARDLTPDMLTSEQRQQLAAVMGDTLAPNGSMVSPRCPHP